MIKKQLVDTYKNQFSDCWAIILGGSSGFGFAAVEKLARHGMNIAVLYREPSIAEKKVKESFATLSASTGTIILSFNINALDAAGREDFIARFAEQDKKKGVKLLLHSIARGNLKPLVSAEEQPGDLNILSAQDIQHTTYAMSNSLLDWVRALLKAGLFHADARIIGLTSEGAHKFWDSYAAVSIAKSSLESLMTYLAVELAPYGLKTNIIQAGITETPSLKKITGSEKLLHIAKTRNPMGRVTTTKDVANVIYLLCTDEAFWINGSVIYADGGEHCC